MQALHDIVKAGKARYLGASSMQDAYSAPRPRTRNRAEIVKAALVDGNPVLTSDRKPEAVTKGLGTYL